MQVIQKNYGKNLNNTIKYKLMKNTNTKNKWKETFKVFITISVVLFVIAILFVYMIKNM